MFFSDASNLCLEIPVAMSIKTIDHLIFMPGIFKGNKMSLLATGLRIYVMVDLERKKQVSL